MHLIYNKIKYTKIFVAYQFTCFLKFFKIVD